MFKPKDYAIALAVISKAERELETEYKTRARILENARHHIQHQWNQWESQHQAWLGLHESQKTPPDQTARIIKARKRQLAAVRKYQHKTNVAKISQSETERKSGGSNS